MENISKNMNTEESLRIIQDMITSVKQDLGKDSFYFLFWGWLVFTASIGHFALLKMEYTYPFVFWILMPIGGIVTAIYSYKQDKKQQAKTYINEFMKYMVIAFVISIILVLSFMSKLELNTYPIVLILYGILLFTSGGALQFKPLIIGGCINWILAITAFFCFFDVQLLILAAAVLLGYIIPGYMLKNSEGVNQNV